MYFLELKKYTFDPLSPPPVHIHTGKPESVGEGPNVYFKKLSLAETHWALIVPTVPCKHDALGLSALFHE